MYLRDRFHPECDRYDKRIMLHGEDFILHIVVTWAYISGKSLVPMLQPLCNTSCKADSLNANTNIIT